MYYLWEGVRFTSRPDRVVYMGSNLEEQGDILVDLINRSFAENPQDISQYHLIEPGAGIATVATYLARKFPWKSVQAVELRASVLWWGRIRAKMKRVPIGFVQEDIFSYVPPTPAVQYCYLTTPILTKLYKNGSFANSLVLCLTFEIEGVTPVETVSLRSWQKAIRLYDFRTPNGVSWGVESPSKLRWDQYPNRLN